MLRQPFAMLESYSTVSRRCRDKGDVTAGAVAMRCDKMAALTESFSTIFISLGVPWEASTNFHSRHHD